MLTRMFCLTLLSMLVAAFSHGEPRRISPDTAYEYQIYQQAYFSHWQPQTALDMLLRVPDTSMQRQPDGSLQVQLHGMDRSYLAVLIDGYPLAGNGENNNRSLSQIPASLIDTIEIIPNSVADLDAHGGAAGIINITLKHSNTEQSQVAASVAGEPVNYSASLLKSVTPVWGQLNVIADLRQQKRRFSIEENNHQQDTIAEDQSHTVSLSYQNPTSQPIRFNSRLLYLHNDEQQQLSEDSVTPFLTSRTDSDTWRLDTSANGLYQDQSNNIRWQLQLLAEQFDASQQPQLQQRPQSQPQPQQPQSLEPDLDHREQRLQIGASLAEKIDEHHWKAGINLLSSDYQIDSFSTSPASSTASAHQIKAKQLSLHAYALDRWSVTQKLHFEAGFRMETHELEQRDQLIGEQEISGNTVWLPNLHLMYRYDDETRIGLSGSQSARHPDFAQRSLYRYRFNEFVFQGNTDLDIEVVSAIDLRYEYQHTRSAHRFTRIRLFHRSITNAIIDTEREEIIDDETLTIIEPQNSDVSAIQQGGELSGGLLLSPDLSLKASAGFYRSYLRATNNNQSQRLSNQPDYRLQASIDKHIQAWRGGAQWRYQGDSEERLNNVRQQDAIQTRSPGHTLDLYLNYRAQQWQASLTASQILASEEQYRSPGREFTITPDTLWRLSVALDF